MRRDFIEISMGQFVHSSSEYQLMTFVYKFLHSATSTFYGNSIEQLMNFWFECYLIVCARCTKHLWPHIWLYFHYICRNFISLYLILWPHGNQARHWSTCGIGASLLLPLRPQLFTVLERLCLVPPLQLLLDGWFEFRCIYFLHLCNPRRSKPDMRTMWLAETDRCSFN